MDLFIIRTLYSVAICQEGITEPGMMLFQQKVFEIGYIPSAIRYIPNALRYIKNALIYIPNALRYIQNALRYIPNTLRYIQNLSDIF